MMRPEDYPENIDEIYHMAIDAVNAPEFVVNPRREGVERGLKEKSLELDLFICFFNTLREHKFNK